MKKQYLFVLLNFFAGTVCAQTIAWHPEQGSILYIGKQVSILDGKNRHYTVEQVASDSFQEPFVPFTQKILNTGFNGNACWVRFRVENPTNEPLLLEVMQPLLDSVSLSFQDTAGRWQTFRNGFRVPLNQKDIKHHYHLFHLPQGKTTFYLRFRDYGSPVPLSIWNEKQYEIKSNRQKLIYGIYMGMMFFVILTNIFWFFSLGWSSNLHYAFFVFCNAIFSGIYDGYIAYFFPNSNLILWEGWNTNFNDANGLLYTLLFLEIKKYLPHLYPRVFFFTFYFLIAVLVQAYLPISILLPMNQIHGLIALSLIAYLGFKVYQKHNKLGGYYSFAYIMFFSICLIETIYAHTGAPAYLFDISYVSLAILVEVISLAYLLSKRLEWDNAAKDQAKEKAQTLLLAQTQENERILANQNEILEKQVDERTSELKNSVAIIQHQSDKLTILMKELHHRVKNNLQIVSSLLNLQSYRLMDTEAAQAVQESKLRVDAMSLIHQSLYQTDDVSTLDIKSYITHLCESLMAAYGYSHADFDLRIEVPNIYLDADSAIPIGLIINELVTNSFKYAYKKTRKPLLKLVLRMEAEITLLVSDNGTDFKKADWERASTSFGKQLIHSLVQQINGQLSLSTDLGTHFNIRFPKK